MRWLRYTIAAATFGMLWAALMRRRAGFPAPHDHPVPPDIQPGAHPATSRVEQEMEDQAMARAHSEVASGEYDMQG